MSGQNPDEYNGWKNRETWALCLHLGNDQGLYSATLDLARAALDAHLTNMAGYGFEVTDDSRAFYVGERVIEWATEWLRDAGDVSVLMDIGSLWRLDIREVGAWALESIQVESS